MGIISRVLNPGWEALLCSSQSLPLSVAAEPSTSSPPLSGTDTSICSFSFCEPIVAVDMDLSLRNIVDSYNDLMINKRDPRVDNWFLMSSPFYTLGICACYIYFVKSLGPRLMRDREPMDLKKTIIAYNFVQVVASIYLIYKGLIHAWLWKYSLKCQPVDYSDDPDEVAVAHMCWWYFFCKLTEFLDTVFFVLRKKNDQITNLHVIHHSVMPAACWWGVKFTPGGHGTFFGMLNTFDIQAYIKQRRLPKIKKDDDAGEKSSIKEKDANFTSKVVGNFFSRATATCYIGQNGLQQDDKE